MYRVAILVACSHTAAVVAAASPLPKAPTAITDANAKDLRPLHEIPENAWEVVWGPKRGELSLLPWESPAKVLDATTFRRLREVGAKKRLIHLAFGPGGDTLAWCENDARVEVHDLNAKRMMVFETGNSQPQMTFSPDGKLLAWGWNQTIRLWDLPFRREVSRLESSGEVKAVAFEADAARSSSPVDVGRFARGT